jgi:hypothetical protein
MKNTSNKKEAFADFQIYPASEDIYVKGEKVPTIDPEDPTHKKSKITKETRSNHNEKDFKEDVSGSDLDVPGAELDDQQEALGSEDEENNAYSIGGDDHNDLDEDKG